MDFPVTFNVNHISLPSVPSSSIASLSIPSLPHFILSIPSLPLPYFLSFLYSIVRNLSLPSSIHLSFLFPSSSSLTFLANLFNIYLAVLPFLAFQVCWDFNVRLRDYLTLDTGVRVKDTILVGEFAQLLFHVSANFFVIVQIFLQLMDTTVLCPEQ